MVNYFVGCLSQKPATSVAVSVLLWIFLLLLLPLFQRFIHLLPGSCNKMATNLLHLLILIKRPPFIYIIFNFIIVYILVSSTFSLHFNFHKKTKPSSSHNPQLKPKPSPKHDVDDQTSTSSSQTNHGESGVLAGWEGDDMWWCQVINDGEDEKTASLQVPEGGLRKVVGDTEEGKTMASSEETPRGVVGSCEEDNKENIVINRVDEEEEVREEDTLDATWQAIMEAKNKGSGPQLKKSGTWTSGDRRGGKEKSGRCQVELKKWQTFKGGRRERENGGVRGWRKMEMVVTDHDELKKRADAFIARFTHDIQLQRLHSYQRFMEMINRGL